MEFLKNKINIYLGFVLMLAFLIETPLRNYIIPGISLIPAVSRILSATIGYLSIFACVLIITRDYINKEKLIKGAIAFGAFAVVDRIIHLFSAVKILALIYQIIRPIVLLLVIYFVLKLITGCRVYKENKVFHLGLLLLGSNALFRIIEYVKIMLAIKSAGNEFYAMLMFLTPSNSTYSILASLCSYAIIFLGLAFARKCIDDDFYVV